MSDPKKQEVKREKAEGKRLVRIVCREQVEYDQTVELSEEDYQTLMAHERIDCRFNDDAYGVIERAIDPHNICSSGSEYTDLEIIDQPQPNQE